MTRMEEAAWHRLLLARLSSTCGAYNVYQPAVYLKELM